MRIGVGQVGITWLVALPGPTREVRAGLERLLEGLGKGWGKAATAEHVASGIRAQWRGPGAHHYHQDPAE